MFLGVDGSAASKKVVRVRRDGEGGLDAAHGLCHRSELKSAHTRAGQQRREDHVVAGRHAHYVVETHVDVLEQTASSPPRS